MRKIETSKGGGGLREMCKKTFPVAKSICESSLNDFTTRSPCFLWFVKDKK